MSDRILNLTMENSWGCDEEVQLKVNNSHDISIGRVIEQVDGLKTMAIFRNEVKTIMEDLEQDYELKKAFESVFKNRVEFEKLKHWVEQFRISQKEEF